MTIFNDLASGLITLAVSVAVMAYIFSLKSRLSCSFYMLSEIAISDIKLEYPKLLSLSRVVYKIFVRSFCLLFKFMSSWSSRMSPPAPPEFFLGTMLT